MGDQYNLRGLAHFLNQLVKSAYIGIVKRCIDLVQHTEGAGPNQKQRKRKAECRQGFFSAGQQLQRAQPFAWRLHGELDSALGKIFLVREPNVRFSALDQAVVYFIEFGIYRPQGIMEALARLAVALGERLRHIVERAPKISLRGSQDTLA